MAVSFQITDPLIPENNRYVTMTGTEFSGLMLMDGKPETSEGILPVSALGELVFGAKTVEEISKEEGLSNQEIALKLGISEQSVRNQLSSALKVLREELIKIGFSFALFFMS